MRWLIEQNIVKNDPVEIATFFRNTDLLDKSKIGEYLGEA
jgi:hypothetical protein